MYKYKAGYYVKSNGIISKRYPNADKALTERDRLRAKYPNPATKIEALHYDGTAPTPIIPEGS